MSSRSSHDSDRTLGPSSEYPSISRFVRHWHLLSPCGVVTRDILDSKYDGSGTESDPYIISFLDDDPGDPKQFPSWRKWMIVATISIVTFIAALGSSIYLGVLQQVEEHFHVSEEVATLGLSLFTLGFVGYTVFNAGTTASQNIQTLLILRFFARFFAACTFTNLTGNLADIFEPTQRGMAFGVYAATPFMGPILGPAIGGFLGTAAGWRWVLGFLTILSGLGLVLAAFLIPETYGAELLNRRAKALSRLTGNQYVSRLSIGKEPGSILAIFKKDLSRPWAILFLDPIVLCLSAWISIVYGTLYLFLAGYQFVYQEARGWSPGSGGLALLGIGGGVLVASAVNIPVSKRFGAKARNDSVPPEVRLQPAMVGGLFIPVGIFWFAWTNAPSVPWPASVVAGSFFGFGMVIVWTSVNNYLVDAYKIYAASALAGQVVMRSIFGAVFPLFTGYMFRGIGLHWASSVPGFVALACAPLPFIFYRFGRQIRARSKYASKANADTAALHEKRGSV